MKKTNLHLVIRVLLLALMSLGLVGCGDQISESTVYHVPNWTAEGKIIAWKSTVKTRKTLISNSEPAGGRDSIVEMNADGSGERELFEIHENSVSYIEKSPLGTYVGYINASLELRVFTASGQFVADIKPSPNVTQFKFSPDEGKIVGSNDYAEMRVFNTTNLVTLRDTNFGGGGVWVDEDTVAYADSVDRTLAFYTVSSQTKTLKNIDISPDVFVASGNRIMSLSGASVYAWIIGSSNYTTRSISYSPYEATDFTGQHISPDGKWVVMGVPGIAVNVATGIHVLNLEAGEGITRIK